MEDAEEVRDALAASEAMLVEVYKDRTLREACLGMEQAAEAATGAEPPGKRRRASIPVPEPTLGPLTLVTDFLTEAAMKDLAKADPSSSDTVEVARRQKEAMAWIWR